MSNMDIVFLSYEEPAAESNFAALIQRFPRTKRLHGVCGLGRAHNITAQMVDSDYYFIVDGDNEIVPSFDFDKIDKPKERNVVINWFSLNPVNGLSYPNGGVKLCARESMLSHNDEKMDFIMSGTHRLIIEREVASINRFNTSTFSSWRAAFRECAKLHANPKDSGFARKNEVWISEKIRVWTTKGVEQPFGSWVIAGARDGVRYAEINENDPSSLLKVNDSAWLRKEFDRRYGEKPQPKGNKPTPQ